MSKQIAILLDNSGSMFVPVGAPNVYNKIQEASGPGPFIRRMMAAQLGAE